jgi:hypothetical protein
MGHLTVHIPQILNTDSFMALISPPRKIQVGFYTKSVTKNQSQRILKHDPYSFRKLKIQFSYSNNYTSTQQLYAGARPAAGNLKYKYKFNVLMELKSSA